MRALIVLAVTFALISCTASCAIAPAGAGTNEPKELHLKAGDSVRIVTRNRERMSLKITEIRPTALAGVTLKPAKHETLAEGQRVVVQYGDLALVEVRRFSAARTVGLPVLVVSMVGLLVIATHPVIPPGMPP